MVFGLLIFFGLLDGAFRSDILFPVSVVCNPGVAFSIPLPAPLLWSGTVVFLSIALYGAFSHPTPSRRLAWTSVFVGGFINGLDRLLNGCVMDYIELPFFPSFNLADIMLSLGAAFLVYAIHEESKVIKPYAS